MSVGVVAIGRNEGERLRTCLESARRDCAHAVYVDSGSADGSVVMAKQMGATVVELDLSIPFTAARARNAGFEKLVEIAPQIEFVQFVDGDCEIVEGWIDRAATAMSAPTPVAATPASPLPSSAQKNGDAGVAATKVGVGVVCGRRRERFPDASIYNKLCDIEWNTPIGKARSCGGDAMIRVSAFRSVNGYDESIIAGEEPEMCVRLRAAGFEVWRIDANMTLHDAAMSKFSQWWKRTLRSGHAYAEGFARHGAPPERHHAKQIRSIWIWGFALPLACVFATVAVAIVKPRWCWIPPLGLLLYPLLMLKVAMSKRRTGLKSADSMLYGFFVVLGKFPQAIGAMKYRISRLRGKRSALIEYKSAASAAQTGGQRVA